MKKKYKYKTGVAIVSVVPDHGNDLFLFGRDSACLSVLYTLAVCSSAHPAKQTAKRTATILSLIQIPAKHADSFAQTASK